MDPNAALTDIRQMIADDEDPFAPDLGDEFYALRDAVASLVEWLDSGGFLPTAWTHRLQMLVTLPDYSQVGIYVTGNEADVHLRGNPSHTWEPPLQRADVHHTGTAHVPGTYHIGSW